MFALATDVVTAFGTLACPAAEAGLDGAAVEAGWLDDMVARPPVETCAALCFASVRYLSWASLNFQQNGGGCSLNGTRGFGEGCPSDSQAGCGGVVTLLRGPNSRRGA
ncbi:hypothetical protein B0T25DRAFT_559419 [Lasiosphaeria hispida]|uniref:Uncharacterized protein n=1 Tax=Lasiosphaeria hispida TaxID=260671 RepID=A0AAJ0M8W4_9PEZI|nr:hypothetical protein B0T25DRAFT_559419 [Lasiosphaeria hispida]